MSEVLSESLNLCNKTNKCTYIKYVLSYISYQHVLIAFAIISRVAFSPWYSCTDELICQKLIIFGETYFVRMHLLVLLLNTLRTGLLNCLNARSWGLIQSEVRFL
jgi:hypothetical protein